MLEFIYRITKEVVGLTQKALGEKLNVTDRAVSKWETGRLFPDVAILEDLCQELGISVSELLAGKKIEAEHYQEETEKILVSSISKAQMYGYQIALYGLLLAVMLLIYVPVFILKNRLNMGIYMIIAVSIIVFVSMVYLNRKIPGREFRNSNIWLEGFRGGIVFAVIVGMDFAVQDSLGGVSRNDMLAIGIICAIGLFISIGAGILGAEIRRQNMKIK